MKTTVLNSILLFILISAATVSAQIIPTIAYPMGGELVYSNPIHFVWSVDGISAGYTYNVQVSLY